MDPNLKQRIIEEAYRLFITKGMKQTSFCDVAVAVHKSKGAVIHYFPSKKKLIDAVVRMRFFPDSQISCEMYSLADKDWNEFFKAIQESDRTGDKQFSKTSEWQSPDMLYAVCFLRP